LDFRLLEEPYAEFVKLITERQFVPYRKRSSGARGSRLQRPRSRKYQEPGEIGFVYKPPDKKIDAGNDYRVVVWTTKRHGGGWVSKDLGWVLILAGPEHNERIVYCSYPLVRRSPNFFDDMGFEAQCARWRVFYRPRTCVKGCPAMPELVHRNGHRKSCYWRCVIHPNDRSHDKRFEDLEVPLPEDAQKRRDANREKRLKRRTKVRAVGGNPYAAMDSRIAHPWTEPEVPIDMFF